MYFTHKLGKMDFFWYFRGEIDTLRIYIPVNRANSCLRALELCLPAEKCNHLQLRAFWQHSAHTPNCSSAEKDGLSSQLKQRNRENESINFVEGSKATILISNFTDDNIKKSKQGDHI